MAGVTPNESKKELVPNPLCSLSLLLQSMELHFEVVVSKDVGASICLIPRALTM